ncbi:MULTISPECIES: hypothetical protein [Sorangium]|uniref:Uncharacterized protein n=1 Tax=Sorangium cellulosum TaxID=56 RepID=A0A4P2QLK8_SORCE|nr:MULTISPECIES: hypothetical protein [Sorangium]AUX30373.1 hypothetical protein SOCE836_024760 [Sorangium cellulosum]WCQ89767.1 hypothetical protein NQZ70_02459 [Sorangium sp. Soce836]
MTDIIAHGEPRGVERLMDRYWFLLRGGAPGAGEGGAGVAGTQVVRDGEFVVVSIEATALGWPEGTLLFRFRSESAPCAACVERAAAFARYRTSGMLAASDVREMLRFAVARCAAAGVDLAHAAAPAAREAGSPAEPGRAEAPASGTRRAARDAGGARRYDAELWLIL